MKHFSIIIPLYNAHFIEYQLETLAFQDYPKENFEVVYVDDGSDEDFQKKYAFLFQQFPDICIQYHFFGDKNGRFRVQEARNRGVSVAKYEDIIFIDADCLFPHYYLSHFNDILLQNDFQVLMGESIGYNHRENSPSLIPQDIVNKSYDLYLSDERYRDFRLPRSIDQLWKVCIGGNLYIQKQVLLCIGGWDNHIASWGGGDIDVGYRLYKAGYEIQFLKGIEVYNIKDDPRISARKFLSFMKNQCYQIKKYNYDSEYFDYVLFRYRYTPVKYKIGIMPEEFRKIFLPRKNILLFCSSTYGIGHFMRTLKIYHSLSEKYNVRIIIEGKFSQSFLEGVYYQILEKGELSSFSDFEDAREKFFQDFLPDIFLVDFFPFGKLSVKEDIDFLIDMTKQNGGKVFSYMRDIFNGKSTISFDEEIISHRNELSKSFESKTFTDIVAQFYTLGDMKYLSEFLLERYISLGKIDGVCIFGDPTIYDIRQEYNFSETVISKIHFLGYLTSGAIGENKKQKTGTILVSTGGMFFNQKSFLKLLSILVSFKEFQIHFFPGEGMTPKQKEKLRIYFSQGNNFHIHDFSQEYYSILERADLVFFCGGYNTFCDMLQYKKYAYVLGKEKENSNYILDREEASTRVQAFQKFGYFYYLDTFDTKTILTLVKNFYSSQYNFDSYQQVNTNGAENIRTFIQSQEI